MSHAISKFISAIDAHFPRPRFRDEEQEAIWTASITRTLMHYDPRVLAEAADDIIRTRDPAKERSRAFPVPRELLAACEAVLRRRKPDQLRLTVSDDPNLQWHPDRQRLADELVSGEMGRRAAQEGWFAALRGFAAQTARLPSVGEIGALRAIAAEFHDRLAQCRAGEAGPASQKLAALGGAMEAREAAQRAKAGV